MKSKKLLYGIVCIALLLTLLVSCNLSTDAPVPSESVGNETEEQTNVSTEKPTETPTEKPEDEPKDNPEDKPEDKPEDTLKVDSIELIIESHYLAGGEHSLDINATTDGITTKIKVTDDMFVTDGYDQPKWDTPGIYNIKVEYGGASARGKVIVINTIEEVDFVTVDGYKLMKSNITKEDGPYNQYVDYTDVSKYEAVRIKCALWRSAALDRHTAIIFYDANKNVIATYDSSNLFAYGVDIPSLNGGFSFNVDTLLSTNGATYVRFSNKTATGTDDLNASGYDIVTPAITGYDFGFDFTQAELVSNTTNMLGSRAQGGAIWDKYLFQFCDGLERIYIKDLESGAVVDTHDFAEKNAQYHCNAVSFGTTVYEGYDLPLLYVSMENKAQHKSLVYGITKNGDDFDFKLVQTIIYPENEVAGTYYQNCFIDGENGYIYIGGYAVENWSSNPGDSNYIVLKRYALPSLYEGDTYYIKASEAIAVGKLPFDVATQGGFIKDGLLYQVYGVNAPQRKIKIIDLKTFTLLYEFNLDVIGITSEPETVSYYNGYFYVTTVNDQIFRFKFN